MADSGEKEKSAQRGKGSLPILFASSLKMLFRDKVGLFWALAFPLLFVLVFGLFFGSTTSVIGKVTVVDNAKNPASKALVTALKGTKAYTVEEADWDLEKARKQIKDDKTSYVIIIPEGFLASDPRTGRPEITAVYSSGDVTVRSSVDSFLNQFANEATMRANGIEPVIDVKLVRTDNKKVTYFDVVFAGILCLALMNYNLAGFAGQLTSFREQKILKRLQTTPLPVGRFMGAQISAFLVLNVLQLVVLLVIGVGLFGAHIYGSYLYVLILSMIGAITFLAMGFMISSFAKTSNAASGAATSISIVFMFLSGVFFPLDSLPNWLYQIVRWLPLSPMVMSMRQITLQEASLASQWTNLLLLFGWLAVFSLVSVAFFRFGEE